MRCYIKYTTLYRARFVAAAVVDVWSSSQILRIARPPHVSHVDASYISHISYPHSHTCTCCEPNLFTYCVRLEPRCPSRIAASWTGQYTTAEHTSTKRKWASSSAAAASNASQGECVSCARACKWRVGVDDVTNWPGRTDRRTAAGVVVFGDANTRIGFVCNSNYDQHAATNRPRTHTNAILFGLCRRVCVCWCVRRLCPL